MALENYIIGASNTGAAGYHNAMAGMDQRNREAEADRHNAFNRQNVDRQYRDKRMADAFEQAALAYDDNDPSAALGLLNGVSNELGVAPPVPEQMVPMLRTRRQMLMSEGRGNSYVNELIAAGYVPGSPEFNQARDTHFGLRARPEPASTTNQPLGAPISRGGKRYQAVQMPDGSFAEIELGNAPDETVPDYVGKAIIESSDKYQSSLSKAESAERMASDFKSKFGNIPAGAMGAASEAVKSFFGSQDDITLARREWQSLKNALVTEQLPPGVASDRDIALIRQGFPDDFSNPAMLADFLIARANVLRGIAEYEGFKSEYLSEHKTTRGVLEAWKQKKGFKSDIQTVEGM